MKPYFLKKELIGFLVVIIVITIFLMRRYREASEIERRGVYIIGVITDIDRAKNGLNIKGWYLFNNSKHFVNAKPGFTFKVSIGKRFFIKVLPDSPNKFDYIIDREVPYCYDNDTSMTRNWNEFPICN